MDREKERLILLFLKSFPWISFAGLSEPPRKIYNPVRKHFPSLITDIPAAFDLQKCTQIKK